MKDTDHIDVSATVREQSALMQQMAVGEYGDERLPHEFGPPQIFECEQMSAEWRELRRGVPTASQFDRIFTAKTMKPSAQQTEYIAELIAETVPGALLFSMDHRPTREMADGIDREPEARQWYSLQTDLDVRRVGFMLTSDRRFGCSPDGLVGDDGGLELKCPILKTQVRYLESGRLPLEYAAQVHGSLIVSGRKWWDFVSYAPGLPPFMIRVEPNEYTRLLKVALEEFHAKYERTRRRIAAM